MRWLTFTYWLYGPKHEPMGLRWYRQYRASRISKMGGV